MNERTFALFGVIGPLVAFVFIGAAIASAPWFSWWDNALSDLGHATNRDSAPYYNFGLAVAGFLVAVYAVTAFKRHARYTSICLAASAFMLQLVAVFDEIYGTLHMIVSVLFFVFIGIASVVYAVEKKSPIAVVALVIGIGSWALYWAEVYKAGIAVPEIISAIAVVSWIISSAFKIIRQRT